MIGSYLMTKDNLATTGEQLFHYLMPLIQLKSNFNYSEARKKKFWTGKELFSIILPNISLENKKITIKNGDIVNGIMDKKTLGGGANGIIQAIFNQYGSKVCRDFLDNLQRLVIAWMEDTGFTIGFGDAVPSQETRDQIQQILQSKMLKSDELIRKAQLGMFRPELNDPIRMAALEIELLNIANEANSEVEEIVQDNMPEDNHFIESVKSGSKGNPTNLNQIMGTIGQQMVDGRRVNFGWNGRTLPHFTKWDNSLASRGFIYSSYMGGMRPHEFFYASMAARVSKINSNIRTADTGYIQRRLIKALEDLKVCYDGTVRDAKSNVVQYVYGPDGFDPVKLEHIPLRLIEMNNKELEEVYFWTVDDINESLLTEIAYERLEDEKKEQMMLVEEEWSQIVQDREDLRTQIFPQLKELGDKTVLSPINFKRMLQEILDQFHITPSDQSDMTPADVIKGVKDLVEYTVLYTPNKKSFPIMKILIRSHLSSKQCIKDMRLPLSVFKHVVETIKHKILYAYVNPGEMVGIVAAQSIGEPVTQLSVRENEKVQIAYEKDGYMEIYQGTFKNFIDTLLKENKVKVFTDDEDSSYLDLEEPFYVAGVNQEEKVRWNKISQLTKHRPKGDLVKITTKSGRSATCTLSHSFLKRGEKSVDPIKGSNLKVGDRVPVIKKLERPNIAKEQKYLKVSDILDLEDGEQVSIGRIKMTNKIMIDEDLAWFLGAYIAKGEGRNAVEGIEGSATEYMVELANKNKAFKERSQIFAERYGLSCCCEKDSTIQNKIFAHFVKKLCGKGAYNKKVPDFIFQASDDVVGMFLRGMFDGQHMAVRYFSVSRDLLEQTALLLSRFGIFTTIKNFKKDNSTMVLEIYGNKYIQSFIDNVGTDLPCKMEAFRNILNEERVLSPKIDLIPSLGGCLARLEKKLKMEGQSENYKRLSKEEVDRDTLRIYLQRFEDRLISNPEFQTNDVERDIETIRQAVHSDVVWDRIEDIQIIPEPDEYVYDFTVPGNETFALSSGILVHNTLNSIDYKDKVFIAGEDNFMGEIGKFIEKEIKEGKPEQKQFLKHDTTYLDLKHKDLKVVCVDEHGRTHWKKLEAVTKHLPGKDGMLLKVTTESGRVVRATKAKSFLARRDNLIVGITGEELKIGDSLPVTISFPSVDSPLKEHDGQELTREYGQKIGREISGGKPVPSYSFISNKSFVLGILEGYLETKSNITKDEVSIVVTDQIADGILDLLSVFSIFAIKEKDRLVLTDIFKDRYLSLIEKMDVKIDDICDDIIPGVVTSGLKGSYGRRDLKAMLEGDLNSKDRSIIAEAVTSEVYFDKVISIEEVKSSYSHVFDFTVADTRNFCLLGGLHVRDTFHFSGVGSKTMITNSGVPRVQEIINMSKDIKTPSMLIYLKPEYSTSREAAMEVKNALEYTEIQDILTNSEIIYATDPEDVDEKDERIYEVYEEMMDIMEMECPDQESLSNWVLVMEFDREAMLQRGIYMQDVHEEIIKNCDVETDIQCVVPDMNSANLAMRIRVRQESMDKEEDYISYFRSLGDCLLTLPLRGIPGIKKVVPTTDCHVRYSVDGSPEIVKEWILSTDGSNLIEVLSNEYVDPIRTTTNDISEILEIFGIEGARFAIIREMESTIAAGGASEVDYRHFSILADLMTYRGKVMQIQRHGFGKSPNIGPLGRATYEVMDKVLINAGIFSERDDMKGTSSNIICGQVPETGTNSFDLLLNQDMLPEPEEVGSNILLPEPKISNIMETTQSPGMEPLQGVDAFEFGEDFMEKMNASKDIRLEDFMRTIESQPSQVEDSDFTFGYDIDNLEERSLPPAEFSDEIKLDIVKSKQVSVNRRRRKK